MKYINNCNTFLVFKEVTHAHLLKISITHNKSRLPLLYLFNTWTTTRSTHQMSFLMEEYTFSNFLIIGLPYSSANCCFSEFQLQLISVPVWVATGLFERTADFTQNTCKLLKQDLFSIHYMFDS